VATRPDFDLAQRWARKFLILHRTERTMQYQQRNAAFPGLTDGGTHRQSSGQPTAAPGTGSGQFSWSGVVPSRLEEVAIRENGFVLALWGGIGIVIGAGLPFIYNVQAGGAAVSSGYVISAGDRFISILFGLLLAGLAVSTRYRPAFRQPIAISSLVLSLLGLAGYCLFTLAGIAGTTEQAGLQWSWYPNIGVVDSIAGCVACAIAAIVMLRTPAPSETR
jgi:hypothetical protein